LNQDTQYWWQVRAINSCDLGSWTSTWTFTTFSTTMAKPSNIGAFANGPWFLDVNGNVHWDGEPTDRIIAISGHLLRQSVMGSDLSYEDLTENRKLREVYDAQVVGSEEVNGTD
jgi:hypothetical protein